MTSKYLKFWGTRGSCPVSGAEYRKFGGNTSCLEICYNETRLIIDAGTGIRPLGEALLKESKKHHHLFLSHTHWDHLIGFPFFAPLYSPDSKITIWSYFPEQNACQKTFETLLSADFFPVHLDQVKAKLEFQSSQTSQPIQIGPLTLHVHPAHHPSPTCCFKIQTPHETIGYASDNELFKGYHGDLNKAPDDPGLVQFFSGCDLLVHEAQYFSEEYIEKIGWGHSSVSNTAALLKKTNIHKWLVIHHDPKHTDEDLFALAALSERLLSTHKIRCQSEWIGDGHIVPLKG
jgi:phosphoribosyl 1,2-cyclic phosphodiesterase